MAKFKFKQVRLHNFLSYADAELSLDRNGYILVNGINENPDDNAKSNGCGKSSLFSAVCWCLTGETVSGAKNVQNVYIDGTTEVTLLFDVNSDQFEITRTKNPSNLKIFMNGVDKSGKGIRDSEKILSQLLPDINSSLINSVIILGQGLPQKFTSNTPSGRKEVLEVLSNSDFMITDLKTRLANRATYLTEQETQKSNERIDAEAVIRVNNENIEKYQEELKNYSDDKKATILTDIENCNKTYDELKNEEKLFKHNLDALNADKEDMSSRLIKHSEKLNKELEEIETTQFKDITDDNELKSLISTKENEIHKLESVVDVCPTCGQKLPNVTKIDTTDLHKEVDELRNKLYKIQDENVVAKQYNDNLINDCKNRFKDEKDELEHQLSSINTGIKTTTNKLNKLSNDIKKCESELYSKKAFIDKFEMQKQSLLSQQQECSDTINKMQDKILYINNELELLNQHVDVNTKMSTAVKRDFRGYLLAGVIDFISNRAKAYSNDVFGTDKLEFRLDKNAIYIGYDGKDYELLSGGEKQKVDIIIQLSIRDMLCSYLNFSSNILVLDEITDSLDDIGCQQVFNLISNRFNDVECVYIISHRADFDIPVDDEIMIKKGDDKISRLIE